MAVRTYLSSAEECPTAYRGLELLATAVILLDKDLSIRYANPAAEECPTPYRGLDLLSTAVILLDKDLSIRYANPAAENLFELSRRQLVGHSAVSVFGDAAPLFQAIDKALANGASYT